MNQPSLCPNCGRKAKSWSRCLDWGFDRDPSTCLPLALKIEVRGGTLWAYNAAHAKALHDYIAADLRERGDGPTGKTMLNILPKWIKSAKNRDVIAQGYQELYERGLALEGDGATS